MLLRWYDVDNDIQMRCWCWKCDYVVCVHGGCSDQDGYPWWEK